MPLLDDCYASYINLAYRIDRNLHMKNELARVGIQAERFEAIKVDDHVWDMDIWATMYNRTKGACGCFVSQMMVMENALKQNKHAIVFEDDLIISSQILQRFEYIDNFIKTKEPNFDVIWLGGTVHINPPYWHTGVNPDLMGSNIGRDAEYIGDKRMFRSYGSFSTHAYIVNKKSIEKVLEMLKSTIPISMGIDWSFIKLAPQLNNFVYLPGCIIQKDNISDIGNGAMTIFSGFRSLGAHWFQDKEENFDFENYNWGETMK
jgi:GR25 family glycosyltransferase involved in LPS biosynthesis